MPALKQRTTRKTKTVRILTDPRPEFVSLVEHGATQTGFKVLKADSQVDDAHVPVTRVRVRPSETSPPSSATAAIGTPARVETLKIAFATSMFDSPATVRAWLSGRGYEDVDRIPLSRVDDAFVTGGEPASAFVKGSVHPIEIVPGVTYYVGKKRKPDDPAESAAKSATKATAEPAQRFNAFLSEISAGLSFQEVLQAGADGLPPGFLDVLTAFAVVVRNNLKVGNVDAVAAIASDFASAITALADAVPEATQPDLPDADVDEAEGDDEDNGEIATRQTSLAEIVEKALAPVTATLADFATRITELEALRATKKSVDVDRLPAPVKPAPAANADDRLIRGLIGISMSPA